MTLDYKPVFLSLSHALSPFFFPFVFESLTALLWNRRGKSLFLQKALEFSDCFHTIMTESLFCICQP